MLDNKSLVSSANYLTDLNSMYSRSIKLKSNNLFISNSTIEATIVYFDKLESIDKKIILLAPVVVSSNEYALLQVENIVLAINSSISDAIVLNESAINGTDLNIDISVSTDSTILKTLNIKVKYGSTTKYDIDSYSNEYLQVLTSAGVIDISMIQVLTDVRNDIILYIDELLLVNDKAEEVQLNTDLVSSMVASVESMRDETIVNRDSSASSATSALDSKNSTQELYDLTVIVKESALASATIASTKASEASVYASNALNSENIATVKATEASDSANIATTKASESSSSAISALSSENSAIASANTATTKASEALQSASNASASAINAEASNQSAISVRDAILAIELQAEGFSDDAEASKILAEKWASEAEDVVVASGKYSAYHYMLKAEEFASLSLSTINDSNVSSATTYSSNKIETDLNVIGFDLAANVTVGPGQVAWNATEGTYDMGLENGSVLKVGQENIRKVTNNSGALISDGRLVMYNGTNGASGRINVKPFTAGFDEAIKLYGVATQSIANGSDGIITIEGKVIGIDTTGASVGEVWADNDILYAKPNDNGMMTKIEPADNELKIVVASVIKAHHTNGTLEIRFMPFNENAYYTKVQNDMLLNNKVPLSGDFTLDLGGL